MWPLYRFAVKKSANVEKRSVGAKPGLTDYSIYSERGNDSAGGQVRILNCIKNVN
jgi:hypothetical protein